MGALQLTHEECTKLTFMIDLSKYFDSFEESLWYMTPAYASMDDILNFGNHIIFDNFMSYLYYIHYS